MTHRGSSRPGLSLIEIIVALTVVAILASLLLVAIGRSRESQRKLSCLSNIRQLGIGAQEFVAVHGHLPEGSEQGLGKKRDVSVFARLLPYLDQPGLASELARTRFVSFQHDPAEFGLSAPVVSLFTCPSDPVSGGTNFRACTGSNHLANDSPRLGVPGGGGNGAFPRFRRLAPPDFRDGLSHTVAFSEKRKSDRRESRFQPKTDVWISGVSNFANPYYLSTDEVVRLCGLAPDPPSTYYGNAGYTWLYAGYFCTQYNHVVPPNAEGVDCECNGSAGNAGIYRASSYHLGGVNVVMLDGSTRFVTDTIDLSIWRNIATRGDGKVSGF